MRAGMPGTLMVGRHQALVREARAMPILPLDGGEEGYKIWPMPFFLVVLVASG